jgi:CubicO group peptidase (beta-lactamase class C family)
VSKLVTSTAVLCLVGDGHVDLDGPVNEHLHTIRLGDASVTVRELLTHTGGVASPREQFADVVPDDQASLLGHTVPCDNQRGTFAASNGGYAVLGQLIADITGTAYPDAAARLVLQPLGMTSSWFPATWPDTDAITGYHLTGNGTFEREPAQVCTMPAADFWEARRASDRWLTKLYVETRKEWNWALRTFMRIRMAPCQSL